MQFSPKGLRCGNLQGGLYNQLLCHRRWLVYGGDRVVAGDKEQDQHGDEALYDAKSPSEGVLSLVGI